MASPRSGWRSLAGLLLWLGCLLSTRGFAAAPDLTALLSKLAAHADRVDAAEHHLDHQRNETNEELDSDGKVEHGVVRTVRVEHPGGQEHEVLVEERRDGEDLTAQTRPRFEEAQARYRELKTKEPKKRDSYRAESPFKASEQEKYRFELLPDAATPGQAWVRFSPAKGPGKQVMEGKALVDVAEGAVVGMDMSPSELPRFVKRVAIHLEFGHAGAEPVLSKLHYEGEGGLLFFKKRFRGTLVFSSYALPAVK